MRKGQVALEYMAIIGLALLIGTPLAIQAQKSSQGLQQSFSNGVAKSALNSMEEAATLVHSQGPPSKVTFRVKLPDGITQTNVTDSYLHIQRKVRGEETNFYNPLNFNVTGEIPTESGVHQMVAEAEDSHVNITPK